MRSYMNRVYSISGQGMPINEYYFAAATVTLSLALTGQISDGLPKTRSGKIMRRILRKIAASQVQS
jgi:hypothetical protein